MRGIRWRRAPAPKFTLQFNAEYSAAGYTEDIDGSFRSLLSVIVCSGHAAAIRRAVKGIPSMNNCFEMRGWPFLFKQFAYVDTGDYLAEPLFERSRLKIRILGEMKKQGTKYRMILCRIRSSQVSDFLDCMKILERKMLLSGHTDYSDFCADLKHALDAAMKAEAAAQAAE